MIRFTQSIPGTLNGRLVYPGASFNLPPATEQEFVDRGLAELVDEIPPVLETAERGAPENTAARIARPRPRRAK